MVGFTDRPLVDKHWRFVLHGDVGGLVTGDSTIATGWLKLEWKPAKHHVRRWRQRHVPECRGNQRASKSVKLDQTLYGPILGVGMPF